MFWNALCYWLDYSYPCDCLSFNFLEFISFYNLYSAACDSCVPYCCLIHENCFTFSKDIFFQKKLQFLDFQAAGEVQKSDKAMEDEKTSSAGSRPENGKFKWGEQRQWLIEFPWSSRQILPQYISSGNDWFSMMTLKLHIPNIDYMAQS